MPRSGRRNVNADIDQSLFGSADRTKRTNSSKSDGHSGLDKPSAIGDFFSGGGTAGSAGRTRSQRTMRLVNKNEVRNLTVRDPKQRPGTLTLSFSEYSRIRQNSVPFAESHEAMRTSQRQQSRAKAMSESMARKAEFEALDRELASNEGPDDLEQDQIAREEEILLHARAAMEDSEEEVRKLKTKILGAKCMAVRDKQVEERRQIEQSEKDEQLRLDEMMETARIGAIEVSEQHEAHLKQVYITGRMELEEQITTRKQHRMLDEELKEQESQQRKVDFARMQEEDVEAARKKAERSRIRMAEAVEINKAAIAMRQASTQAEREAELLRVEFLMAKAEAEEAEELQAKIEKVEADRVFAEQLKLQEAANDTQAVRDELAAKRAWVEKERKLRAKDLADAKIKAAGLRNLTLSREAQIQLTVQKQVEQAVADQYDFERTLAAQAQLIEVTKQTDVELRQRRIDNREVVLSQVAEREQQAVRERAEFFKEGIAIDQEAQLRRARIDAIKARMLADVESEGVEPCYLDAVKREVVRT